MKVCLVYVILFPLCIFAKDASWVVTDISGRVEYRLFGKETWKTVSNKMLPSENLQIRVLDSSHIYLDKPGEFSLVLFSNSVVEIVNLEMRKVKTWHVSMGYGQGYFSTSPVPVDRESTRYIFHYKNLRGEGQGAFHFSSQPQIQVERGTFVLSDPKNQMKEVLSGGTGIYWDGNEYSTQLPQQGNQESVQDFLCCLSFRSLVEWDMYLHNRKQKHFNDVLTGKVSGRVGLHFTQWSEKGNEKSWLSTSLNKLLKNHLEIYTWSDVYSLNSEQVHKMMPGMQFDWEVFSSVDTFLIKEQAVFSDITQKYEVQFQTKVSWKITFVQKGMELEEVFLFYQDTSSYHTFSQEGLSLRQHKKEIYKRLEEKSLEALGKNVDDKLKNLFLWHGASSISSL